MTLETRFSSGKRFVQGRISTGSVGKRFKIANLQKFKLQRHPFQGKKALFSHTNHKLYTPSHPMSVTAQAPPSVGPLENRASGVTRKLR